MVRRTDLVELAGLLQPSLSDRFQGIESADGVNVGRVHGQLEGCLRCRYPTLANERGVVRRLRSA